MKNTETRENVSRSLERTEHPAGPDYTLPHLEKSSWASNRISKMDGVGTTSGDQQASLMNLSNFFTL
jgi:hypothetical protein